MLVKLCKTPISYQSFERKCKPFCWTNNSLVQWRYLFTKICWTLKLVNITLAFTQLSRNVNYTYRPISILPMISKILEKLICKQFSNHFDNIFSKFQWGFWKGFGAQHCLLLTIDGKNYLIVMRFLVQFSLIYQKLLTVFVMIF